MNRYYLAISLLCLGLALSVTVSGQQSLSALMEEYSTAARDKDYERQHEIGNRLVKYISEWLQKDLKGRRADMPIIIRYLVSHEMPVRTTAAAFLGTAAQLRPQDLKPLIAGYETQIIQAYKERYATDDVWESKFSGSLLRALTFAQPLSKETETFLAGLVADPAVSSRHWSFAVFALAQSAEGSDKAREVATGVLRSSNKERLLDLLPMLALLRNPDAAIVTEFKALLRHKDPEVVTAALAAVPEWGTSATPLLEEIDMVINTPTAPEEVRQLAATIANRIRSSGPIVRQ